MGLCLWLLPILLAGPPVSATPKIPEAVPGNTHANSSSLSKLGLEDLLAGLRHNVSLEPLARALNEKADANIESEGRRFPGGFSLGVDGELAQPASVDSRMQAVLKHRISLGIDTEALEARFRSGAQEDLLAKRQELRELELEVAKEYSLLRARQAAVLIDRQTISLVVPMVRKASRAAQLGTMSGFFATRWRLMLDTMNGELEEALGSFALSVATLSKITGIAINSDPAVLSLSPLPYMNREVELKEDSYPPAQESILHRRAIAAQATQLGAGRSMEAGIGIARNLFDKSNGLVVQLDIPLGVASASASEIRSLEHESAVQKAAADLAFSRAKNHAVQLHADVERAANAAKITATRTSELERLLRVATALFDNGSGDISDVIEISKEWHEAELRLVDQRQAVEQATSALNFFVSGVPL